VTTSPPSAVKNSKADNREIKTASTPPDTKPVDPLSDLLQPLRTALGTENRPQISDALLSLANHFGETPDAFEPVALTLATESVFANSFSLLREIAMEIGSAELVRLMSRVASHMLHQKHAVSLRLAALSSLAESSDVSAAELQAIARLSVEDSNSQIRQSAVAALGEQMVRTRSLATHEFLSDQLIWIIQSSVDREARTQAAQVLARENQGMPDKVQGALLNYLETVPTPQNRMLLASAIGGETDAGRMFALNQLNLAFAEATGLEMKRNILFTIARVGKQDAPRFLTQLAQLDPGIAIDAQEYVALLQAGVTNADHLHEAKTAWETERISEEASESRNTP
jgi:hypothetical protein